MESSYKINEIRIYYEVIEQGTNFIKPIIESSLKKADIDIDIKLIKLIGSTSYYSKRLAPIIFWKNPDILISAVINSVEYPLLVIEFSNAVFTEDHELQRFDGLIATAKNECIYTKISPLHKESPSKHGGNVHFNYVEPFSLIYRKFGKLFYHFDWPCNKQGIVDVDKKYLSVPKKINEFDLLIEAIITSIKNIGVRDNAWIANVEKLLENNPFFKKWKKQVSTSEITDVSLLKTSRTEWLTKQKELILKLNRFGHSMDPERGMLSYYGTLYNKVISKMIFDDINLAWCKSIPKEKDIKDYIKKSGLKRGYDFLYCFMLGSGLYNNKDFQKIIEIYKKDDSLNLEIEITSFLNKNYFKLNKALRTIFKNSMNFIAVDKNNNQKLKLIWEDFNESEGFKYYPDTTNLIPRDNFDEDDVTYITVHNVLRKNNFVILAVSYPGAQGDRVILTQPGAGRTQERRYIDVISYLPNKVTILQENKGEYLSDETQKEINELSKYKNVAKYTNAVNTFIDRFDSSAPKIIKIGVGFWANSKFTIKKVKDLDLKELDYFLYITPDKKRWFIWSTSKEQIFKITNGKVDLPKTYELLENIANDAKLL